MRQDRRSIPLLIAFTLFVTCSFGCSFAGGERVFVRKVIDGDTVILENGTRVRYLGINAPEIPHKDSPGEPFGWAATRRNRQLVQGKWVRMVPAGDRIDRFGRTLALVYLPDGRMVNEILVREGLAYFCFFGSRPPHADILLAAQRAAIRHKVGLWARPPRRVEPYYVGNKRTFRFHRPWCPYGRRVGRRNRVVFTKRLQAFKEGYCRCKKCLP